MLRGLYLRLGLLGWRRCGGCWASPVAMAAPPLLPLLLSWWWWRAAFLPEREAPCERERWLWFWLWPSDEEGFDVPGLLWAFSIVVPCVSKTTRFTKLPQIIYPPVNIKAVTCFVASEIINLAKVLNASLNLWTPKAILLNLTLFW